MVAKSVVSPSGRGAWRPQGPMVDGDHARRGCGCGDHCSVRVGENSFEEGDVALTMNDPASADQPAGERRAEGSSP